MTAVPSTLDPSVAPGILRGLKSPFHLTNHALRRRGIDAAGSAEVIDAFDVVLAALETTPAVAVTKPPTPSFHSAGLQSALVKTMPTLSSITSAGVADCLRRMGENPDIAEADAEKLLWLRSTLERLREELSAAISDRAWEGTLAAHAAAYLAVVERRIAKMEPRWAEGFIGTIATDVGTPAIPVLERMAVSESLDPILRDEAKAELECLLRKFGGRAVHLGDGHLVDIAPVEETDRLYVGHDGVIHLEEAEHTNMRAFCNKLKKRPRHLERMRRWQAADPTRRSIKIAIWPDRDWTEVLRQEELLFEIAEAAVPFYVGGRFLPPNKLREIYDAIRRKQRQLGLDKLNPDFHRRMATLDDAARYLKVRI